MSDYLQLSDHGKRRMAQRDVAQRDIDYVLANGEWRVQQGWFGGDTRTEVVLSRRLIPPEDVRGYGHLAGIVLILDDNGAWLITTFKQRSRESNLRRPYIREHTPWRSYLENGLAA